MTPDPCLVVPPVFDADEPLGTEPLECLLDFVEEEDLLPRPNPKLLPHPPKPKRRFIKPPIEEELPPTDLPVY